MFKVQFADIGEGLTEGKVIEILVKVGDVVKAGDSLFSVETDKVNAEIPSPVAGKVAALLIKPNQNINVGDVVVEIETNGKADASPSKPTKNEPQEENASVVGATPVSNEVIKRATVAKTETSSSSTGIVRTSPLARKVAAAKNIDLTTVSGTGPNGRILVGDLDKPGSTSQPNASKASMMSNVSADAPLEWTAVPMNGIRKATVKSMTKSHTETAAFTGIRNIDCTPLYELRQQLKTIAEQKGVKLTYLPFIIKAVAYALKEMPGINVRGDFENNQILQMHNINIGIAVDTPDGLMVPVIKGADQLSIFQIAQKVVELAGKARERKLSLGEMRDATFTITNFGSVGLDYATPIINSPEAAILGIGALTKTPVYVDDVVVPRYMMPFSVTCDHRIIDGADAARFLIKVKEYLDQPLSLLNLSL